MKLQWLILTVLVVLAVTGAAMVLSLLPPRMPAGQVNFAPADPSGTPIVLGLLAEHDVLDQRRRVRTLTNYLTRTLGRPVKFATENRYEFIYDGLRDERIDVALLPAMPALGATVRVDVQLIAHLERPQQSRDAATIFVAAGSSYTSLEDLDDASIALVRGCVAGELYPRYELQRRGLAAEGTGPRFIWANAHAEVIRLVVEGEADAGATWHRHLRRVQAIHAEESLRPLLVSEPLPGHVVVARTGFAEQHGRTLRDVLHTMHQDLEGRQALSALDAAAFGPVEPGDLDHVQNMSREVIELRELLGLSTPPESVAPPLGIDEP